MTDWTNSVLAEVQKIDPGATLVGGTGIQGDPASGGSVHILVNGVEIPIGNGTPIEQVARLVGIYAPTPAKPAVAVAQPPKRDPGLDESGVPFLENGRWYKYGIFGIKMSCAAPTVEQISVVPPSIKPAVLEKIKAELIADPPLTDEAAQPLLRVYGFVLGLKG